MITPKDSPSRAVVQRVAEDYRRRGYEVVVAPRGSELPGFLKDAAPDLIAHRGDEHVVVEVKGSPEDVNPDQLSAIAQNIGSQSGWRFVVMASGPQSDAQAGERVLDEQAIRRGLAEANILADGGHPEAALMLAWASVEALLRLIVVREGAESPRTDPASLVRSAASEGLVSRDEWANLNEAFRLRSAIVHGLRPEAGSNAADVRNVAKSLSRISESLFSELREPA